MSDPTAPMHGLLRYLQRHENEMVRLLGRFVRCESPSGDKNAVDRFAQIVIKEWRQRGADVRVLHQAQRGNHVRAELHLGKGRPAGQILVLGHLDTVHPLGTIPRMPFRISRGCAWGPGTFDMKGGLVLALFAVDALRATGIRPSERLVFLWTSDEEIGSETSRRVIEQEARRSDAVLVLEPPLGLEGRLKTSRKGVATTEIIVKGRAAHAGINPGEGINAVHELVLQIVRIMKMNKPQQGTTVQTTVFAGGTVPNVVPDCARAQVDIRFARVADGKRVVRQMRALKPILKGARIKVSIKGIRPPLEHTAAVRALFRRAQSLMREIGLPLGEAATGGGSDGNFTAALGIPTLDGLGTVGDGAHSLREHALIRALPERAALLAGLFATL